MQRWLVPSPSLSRTQLLRLNSEFANYTPAERSMLRVTLHGFANFEYFLAGVKHRYTRG